jgi:hypothetical protein
LNKNILGTETINIEVNRVIVKKKNSFDIAKNDLPNLENSQDLAAPAAVSVNEIN